MLSAVLQPPSFPVVFKLKKSLIGLIYIQFYTLQEAFPCLIPGLSSDASVRRLITVKCLGSVELDPALQPKTCAISILQKHALVLHKVQTLFYV